MSSNSSDSRNAVSPSDSGQPAAASPEGEQQQPAQRRTGWDIFKSILIQIVIFYFISSFFRGRQAPLTNPDGSAPVAGFNLFAKDDKLVWQKLFIERV